MRSLRKYAELEIDPRLRSASLAPGRLYPRITVIAGRLVKISPSLVIRQTRPEVVRGNIPSRADTGTVHVCEFEAGKIFRSIRFPEKIDPDSAKAEYRNGVLRLTAAIAKPATAQKVEIKAA